MIRLLFWEIVKDARNNEISILDNDPLDGEYIQTIRMGFNVVENNILYENIPNLNINNMDLFFELLTKYVYVALETYELIHNSANIKRLIVNLLSNITLNEMDDLERFVIKYANFITDSSFRNQIFSTDILNDKVGIIKGQSLSQTYHQETPFAFVSHFENYIGENLVTFNLPRISYGIQDNTCYIYAIQNKDKQNII